MNLYSWAILAKAINYWSLSWLHKVWNNSDLHFKVGCYPKENNLWNRTRDKLLLWIHMGLSDQRSLYHIPNVIIPTLLWVSCLWWIVWSQISFVRIPNEKQYHPNIIWKFQSNQPNMVSATASNVIRSQSLKLHLYLVLC